MAEDLPKIEGKLVETIKIDGLAEMVQDYTEFGIDLITENDVMKGVPIVGTLVNISKAVGSVRDRIYLKKIISFLYKIGETTQQQREKFIQDNCQDTKQFEEAVLLILEQADNMNKSALIGKIFKACILSKITYSQALTLSAMVNKALWQDLVCMINRDFTDEIKMRLCNCGILNLGLMRRQHIDETKKPTETKETIDGFGYHENQYFQMLIDIAKI